MEADESQNTARLWAALNKNIEETEPPRLALPDNAAPEAYRFRDRLAHSFANGFLPLLLLLTATALLSEDWSQPLHLLGGLGVALVAALLFRPVVATRFGLRRGALLLWLPVMMVTLPIWQLVPVAVITKQTRYEGVIGQKPLDYVLAETLQHQLEAIFTWSSLGTLLICTLAVTFFVGKVRSHFPWLYHFAPGKFPRFLLLILLIAPWTFAYQQTRLNRSVQEWKAEVEPIFRSFPVARLPQDGPVNSWRDLERSLIQSIVPKIPNDLTLHEIGSEELDQFQMLEKRALTALQDHPPTSVPELKACFLTLEQFTARSQLTNDTVRLTTLIEGRLFHGVRPSYDDTPWTRGVIPWLKSPARNARELKRALASLEELNSRRLSALEDYDTKVISILKGTLKRPSPAVTVRRNVDSLLSVRFVNDLPPSPMRILGYQVSSSPTQLLEDKKCVELTEEWLRHRESYSQGFTSAKKLLLTRGQDDSDLSLFYRGVIAQASPSLEERALRETTVILAKIMLFRCENGHLPKSLQQIGLPPDSRWTLKRVGQELRLHDSRNPQKSLENDVWSLH